MTSYWRFPGALMSIFLSYCLGPEAFQLCVWTISILYLLAWTCSAVQVIFWHQKLNSWFYVLHKVPSFRKYAYQFWLKLHALCMGTIRIKVLWCLFLSILPTLYVHTLHMTAVWLQTILTKIRLKLKARKVSCEIVKNISS